MEKVHEGAATLSALGLRAHMSKKLYSTAKWKRYMKARQRYQLRAIRESRYRRRGYIPLRRIPARRLPFLTLRAPDTLSIIHSPTETVAFLREFRLFSQRNNLTLDLTAVTDITVDAITALTAEILRLGDTRLV